MALPHFPTKYGSPAIITARQSIEHGHAARPLPVCPPDLILLFQKRLWREVSASAVEKAAGDRAPFVVLDRGQAPVAVAGGFGVGAPAAAEARADPTLLDSCQRALAAAEIDATIGSTWTTDAPFRETEAEVREMQADGVLAVEMELAAVYAVAQVRGVAAAGLCVVSDSLSDLTWRPHFRDPHVQEQLQAVFDVTVATLARSTADALPVTPHVRQTP